MLSMTNVRKIVFTLSAYQGQIQRALGETFQPHSPLSHSLSPLWFAFCGSSEGLSSQPRVQSSLRLAGDDSTGPRNPIGRAGGEDDSKGRRRRSDECVWVWCLGVVWAFGPEREWRFLKAVLPQQAHPSEGPLATSPAAVTRVQETTADGHRE